MDKRWLRLLLVVVFVPLGAYQAAAGWQTYEQLRWPENVPVAGFEMGAPWPSVTNVGPRAAEAGLAVGDRVVEVQGQPFRGMMTLHGVMEKLFPGDRVRVTTGTREFSWQMEANSGRAGLYWTILQAVLWIGVPLFCLGIGVWRVMARPMEKGRWVMLGLLASAPYVVIQPGPFAASLGWMGGSFLLLHAAMKTGWVLFLPSTRWIAMAVGAMVAAMVLLEALRTWGAPVGLMGWIDPLHTVRTLVPWIQVMAIGAFLWGRLGRSI